MKDVVILLGAPSSGKTELSHELSRILKAPVISWGELAKKQKIDTHSMTTVEKESLVSILRKELTSHENEMLIIRGFGIHPHEASEIVRWVDERLIAKLTVIRVNVSLNYLLHTKQRDEDIQRITDEYYLSHRNSIKVDAILAARASSLFEVDGEQNVRNVATDCLSGMRINTKPYSMYDFVESTKLNTKYGLFELRAYQSKVDYSYHLALIKGDVRDSKGVLTRVHSSCITGDILFSNHCECGEQLELALEIISQQDSGILFYLFQEGRGINIINKIKAYKLQSEGMDTVEANLALGLPSEMRSYDIVRDVLEDLNVCSIRLLSNNPDKSIKLRKLGVLIDDVVPHVIEPNEINKRYLETKKRKMNHVL